MSHIDEGALHAYLDGALEEYPAADAVRIREHLDGCAECTERLETERSIRTEAHAILGLAAPDVELPSFEDLRAYVERTRPRGGAISVHAYRMRLAASVVLALGTGWMLRGGVPTSAPMARAVAESAASDAVGPDPAAPAESMALTSATAAAEEVDLAGAAGSRGGPAPAATLARADLPSGVVADRQAIGSTRSAEAEIGPLPEAEIRSVPEAELRAAAAPVFAEAQKQRAPADQDLATGGGVAADSPATADQVASLESDVADLAAPPALADEEAPDAGRVAGGARFADEVITESLDEMVTTAANDQPEAVAAEPAAEGVDRDDPAPRRERAAGPPVTSALEQNSFAARRAVADDALPTSDEPSMAVPGLEVVTVTSLGEGTAPDGTLVVQRMEDGSLLEIYHLLPDVAADIVPAPPAGFNEVSVLTEGGWIVLQGPRTAEELDGLLESLFPAG